MRGLLLFISIFIMLQCGNLFAMGGQKPLPGLDTTKNVDLGRYVGKWYEIARIPQTFETGCVGVTADYSLRSDGKIDVKNTCRKSSCAGRVSEANGLGRVVDSETNAKLKVSFFWPFEGDYWILELDPEYFYAVVGSPDRKSFWILSRTPSLPDSLVESILSRFHEKGFDFDHLVKTQACE